MPRAVFHREMLAGEQLIYEAEILHLRPEGASVAGRVLVDGQADGRGRDLLRPPGPESLAATVRRPQFRLQRRNALSGGANDRAVAAHEVGRNRRRPARLRLSEPIRRTARTFWARTAATSIHRVQRGAAREPADGANRPLLTDHGCIVASGRHHRHRRDQPHRARRRLPSGSSLLEGRSGVRPIRSFDPSACPSASPARSRRSTPRIRREEGPPQPAR